MSLGHSELNNLGWSEWFEERSRCEPGQTIARVAAVDRELLLLVDEDGPFRAKLAGSYLHRHSQPHELPCVGDWVRLEKEDRDITTLASACRYRDCSHMGGPGCAVLEAVDSGELSREQYESYQKLMGESEFYDMSYAKSGRRTGTLADSSSRPRRMSATTRCGKCGGWGGVLEGDNPGK
jgi:hypothetical protein